MELTNKPQFKQGKDVETFLDEWFRHEGWIVCPMSLYDEMALHLGDRYFVRGTQVVKIEYKSGIQTFYTGNVFLETRSVQKGKDYPGWVYTCQADFIFYAALLNHKILVFKPQRLRSRIEWLKTQYREAQTGNHQNEGYETCGLLIPLGYAEQRLAEKVIAI